MRFDFESRVQVTKESSDYTLASLAKRIDTTAVEKLKQAGAGEDNLREIHLRLKRLKGGDDSSEL